MLLFAWLGLFFVLKWSSQSPDLNPIKHDWKMLKQRLNAYPNSPIGFLQLRQLVEESFHTITVEQCNRLYASMLNQIVTTW